MSQAEDLPAAAVVREEIELPGLQTRDRIIGLAMEGKLTPAQADKWARERGEEPFQTEPDPSRFNPMVEFDWTLAMATAWILERTPEALRAAWADFTSECWDWQRFEAIVPQPREPGGMRQLLGWKPGPQDAPTPRSVLNRARENRDGLVTTSEETERELRTALREGTLVARHGRNADPIEKDRWRALSAFKPPQKSGPHDAVFDADGRMVFENVKVDRQVVMALWSDDTTATAGKPEPLNEPTKLTEMQLRALAADMPQNLNREEYEDVLKGRAGPDRVVDRTIVRKIRKSDPQRRPAQRPRKLAD